MTLATTLCSSRRRSTSSDGIGPAMSAQTSPAESDSSRGVTTSTPAMSARPSFSRGRAHVSARPPRSAEPVVELERLGERPPVLEGVEAAGGHQRPGRDVRRAPDPQPGDVRAAVEGRNRRREALPRGRCRPHDARCRAGRRATCGSRRRRRRRRVRPATRPRRRSRGRRRRRAGCARPPRRPRSRAATAAAISRSGSLTPLDECTHVIARQRVRGFSARATAPRSRRRRPSPARRRGGCGGRSRRRAARGGGATRASRRSRARSSRPRRPVAGAAARRRAPSPIVVESVSATWSGDVPRYEAAAARASSSSAASDWRR